MEERLLTLEEVTDYLRLSKSTVYQLAQQGKIPALKIGGVWRFKRELLDDWIAERTGATHMEGNEAPKNKGEGINGHPLMTVQEVAKYLSLHELTVRRLAREGGIPAFKVGRQWRVKRDLLERWIERKTAKGSR